MSIEQQIRAANSWGGGQNLPHSWAFARDNRIYYLVNGGLLLSHVDRGLAMSEKAIGRDAVQRTAPMTKEEEMLRERMRSSAQGISSFDYHGATDQLVVIAEGTIFRLSNSGQCTEISAAQPGARLHTSLSGDGALLGFVRNRNVFLVDVATGKEVQVSDASGTVLAGEGDFIHQEGQCLIRRVCCVSHGALMCVVGCCLSVQSSQRTGRTGSPRRWLMATIACCTWSSMRLPVSERASEIERALVRFTELCVAVHVFNIVSPGIEGTVDPFRYALTGTKNSTVRVVLATVNLVSGWWRVLLLHVLIVVPRGGRPVGA